METIDTPRILDFEREVARRKLLSEFDMMICEWPIESMEIFLEAVQRFREEKDEYIYIEQ